MDLPGFFTFTNRWGTSLEFAGIKCIDEVAMDLNEELSKLKSAKEHHLNVRRHTLNAYGRAFYGMDFLAVATLNRSLCLLRAFCQLIEDRNIVAAAPLIRMQLDNVLRFSAAWVVLNPHEFSLNVLNGIPIRKMKDKNGKKLDDRYLVEMLSVEHDWIKSVYEHCSGYVHLSEKHIFNALTLGEEEQSIELKISDRDEWAPESLYFEAVGAFGAITALVLKYAQGWAISKAHPELLNTVEGAS